MGSHALLGQLLSVGFLIIAIISTFQILRTVIHRHSPKSFLFGFLLICFLWSSLRCLFWMAFDMRNWTTAAVNMVTSLPSACQVLMFSLLTLYYAKLSEGLEWTKKQRAYVQLCILGNVVAFAVFMGWAILLGEVEETKTVIALYYLSAAAVFGLLVAAAMFVFRRNRKRSNSLSLRAYTETGGSGESIMKYTMVSVLLSRCIYDVLAAFVEHDIFRQEYSQDGASGWTFALLTFWEIVPSLMVLVFFRTIPATPNSYIVPLVRCLGIWSWSAKNCGWCVPPVLDNQASAAAQSRRKRRRRKGRKPAAFMAHGGGGVGGAPDYYAYDDEEYGPSSGVGLGGAGGLGSHLLDDLDDVDVGASDDQSGSEGSDDEHDGGRSDVDSFDDEPQGPMSYSYNVHHNLMQHSYDTGRSSPDDYYAITPIGGSVNQQHLQHDVRMGLLSNNSVGGLEYHRRGSYH